MHKYRLILAATTAFICIGATPFSGVLAQDLASARAGAVWDEQDTSQTTENTLEEIEPKPLSLKDLENLTQDDGPKRRALVHDSQTNSIENLYSERSAEDLTLFGYDLFKDATKPSASIPAGTVSEDYVVSVGDKIEVAVRGQENTRKIYEVNSEGQLVTDLFSPVMATGKTLGDIRRTLSDEASTLHNVSLSLTLVQARQIDVLVIGDVEKPGRKTLTPFHSVLDALIEAEGIKRSGSLRRIKLVRGGRSEFVDLYHMLMQGGSSADKTLRDGDRIIVPPIGPTVAVSGAVKRPAIYEIKKGEKLSTLELLGMAGGVLSPGANRFINLSVGPDGLEIVEDVSEPMKKIFSDGGLLQVAQAKEKRTRNVELSGHTRDAGSHDLNKAKTLSALIKNEQVFGDSLYPLIGVIERRDQNTLSKSLISFSPRAALQKTGDMPLAEGDIVHLFSMEQIHALTQTNSSGGFQSVSYQNKQDIGKDSPIKDPAVISFLQERYAFVRGSVRNAGAYPVSTDTTLDAILSVAGGTTIEADTDNIEVTSRLIPTDEMADAAGINRQTVSLSSAQTKDILIKAGDTVRVSQKFMRVQEQTITLMGEVKNPGKYDLVPGDTLMSLIDRAGGLSDTAYPDGVIFSRASERKQEENKYKTQARDLELKLADMLRTEDKDKKPDMAQVQTAQALISQLKDAKAVGRITVEADPDILAANPDQDILLESGDKIYIPRRPLTVRVGGEVLSPAALQFRKGKAADTYIDEAGGTTYFADKDRAFVTYPDGSSSPLSISAWKQGVTMIPPGSTIIVPRDPKPFDFLESAETISTILANIALTGFYLDDLGDDD